MECPVKRRAEVLNRIVERVVELPSGDPDGRLLARVEHYHTDYTARFAQHSLAQQLTVMRGQDIHSARRENADLLGVPDPILQWMFIELEAIHKDHVDGRRGFRCGDAQDEDAHARE